MAETYSIEVCKNLEAVFYKAELHRPMRVSHYEEGAELTYDVQSVDSANHGKIKLRVEKFAGGGFAGQVYRVQVLAIDASNGLIKGLETGKMYAMKILIPSSTFSLIFRNALYWIGFQGPFQLQVNPVAARAGALWQKFIRRGSKIQFGDERTVVDIHATFVDRILGSCGELSEWVDGRTWRLEVDDHLDFLQKWRNGKQVDNAKLGSPEYRAKLAFMDKFVVLLHDMGGYEFARQYEWSTCKSQPNCLKRKETGDDPEAGLVAVDFRAGLALLPFLPMSPGDFRLIFKGLERGSLVQFDRGSISKLERFINEHPDDFSDMREMFEELKASERIYRDSVPDITHNHIRLFYSHSLWSTMLNSAITGWKVQNIVDKSCAERLGRSKILTLVFMVIGLIPFMGKFVQRIWGRPDWRAHYKSMLTSRNYFRCAMRARMAEKTIGWHRAGRVNKNRALKVADSVARFLCHLPFSLLPAGLHRLATDWQYAKDWLVYFLIRPVRLYFNTKLREEWLRDMVTDGRKKHILSEEDANVIISQIKEPFIQKYLKSLTVHVCTLPVTQVVSVIVAVIFWIMNPEMSEKSRGFAVAGILVAFQLTPISPGSLVRGLYVLYLVIRERNFRDYNIALFLGFFKYIGYLAFPIQMAYRYPVLARFMASYWANESVHIVPVFGESGALLERWVFCLFYNWPLTIRRRIRKRLEIRASMENRYWHIGLCAVLAAGIFGIADYSFSNSTGKFPGLKDIWWISVLAPIICGSISTFGCGGATLQKRFIGAALCGVMTGIFYTAFTVLLSQHADLTVGEIISNCVWRIFIFSILSTIGAIITELKITDPELN